MSWMLLVVFLDVSRTPHVSWHATYAACERQMVSRISAVMGEGPGIDRAECQLRQDPRLLVLGREGFR